MAGFISLETVIIYFRHLIGLQGFISLETGNYEGFISLETVIIYHRHLIGMRNWTIYCI